MTNDELEQRHKALAESVELLAASARDLRRVVEAQLTREHERHTRDQKFLGLIAEVLKEWARDGGAQ